LDEVRVAIKLGNKQADNTENSSTVFESRQMKQQQNMWHTVLEIPSNIEDVSEWLEDWEESNKEKNQGLFTEFDSFCESA
jgi:hypothetical protein